MFGFYDFSVFQSKEMALGVNLRICYFMAKLEFWKSDYKMDFLYPAIGAFNILQLPTSRSYPSVFLPKRSESTSPWKKGGAIFRAYSSHKIYEWPHFSIFFGVL